MRSLRGLFIHAAMLAASAALALYVWTKDGKSEPEQGLEAEVWTGSPETIQSVRFESESMKVQLAPRSDTHGRYLVGKLEKAAETPANPHANVPGAPQQPPANQSQGPTLKHFVSVTAGEKLFEQLAPLMAYRSLGKVDAKRAPEFGFDKPQGTLYVKVAGAERALEVGSVAPGGADRYVRDKKSSEAWAIKGEVIDNFLYADSRLLERDLHKFTPEEVRRAVVQKGPKSRELLRVEDKRDVWANPATPTKQDETAGNWMSKVQRLRIMEYTEKPPAGQALVAKVEYLGAGTKPLGFVEIVRVGEGANAEYYARTEFTRWFGKMIKTAGEQIEQDVASVLK